MSWGTFGLAGIAVLFVLVFVVARRGWNPIALVVAASNFLVASVHFVAPFRGVLDPNYVGYTFGLVSADRGYKVAALAGFFLVVGVVSATLAARQARGPAAAVVAVFNGVVLIVFGLPLIQGALTNPSRYVMQFGEYLTVPAEIALPLTLLIVLMPTVLGVVWSVGRLRAPSDRILPAV